MTLIDILLHIMSAILIVHIISFIVLVFILLGESDMKLFNKIEDKLKKIGWTIDNDGTTFLTLYRKDKIKRTTTHVGLYSSGEVECYTMSGPERVSETIMTAEDYKLLLKLMKKRGWPSVG